MTYRDLHENINSTGSSSINEKLSFHHIISFVTTISTLSDLYKRINMISSSALFARILQDPLHPIGKTTTIIKKTQRILCHSKKFYNNKSHQNNLATKKN
jgi:hypothetical protein